MTALHYALLFLLAFGVFAAAIAFAWSYYRKKHDKEKF